MTQKIQFSPSTFLERQCPGLQLDEIISLDLWGRIYGLMFLRWDPSDSAEITHRLDFLLLLGATPEEVRRYLTVTPASYPNARVGESIVNTPVWDGFTQSQEISLQEFFTRCLTRMTG